MRNSTTPLSNSLLAKLAGAGSPLRTMVRVVITWSLVTMPAVAMNSDISLVTATSEANQLTQEQQNRVKTVLFVDRTVADYQDLISQLSDESSVVVLDADRNGVLQISETLAAYQKLDSIQILSHGHAGRLLLGSSELNNTNLDDYQSALQGWGRSLTETGDILLYGCNVAEGEVGNNFVHQLSELTGADIAASSDVTGSDMLGANWLLEKQTDKIEVSSAIPEALLQQYKHLLALPANGFQDIAPVDVTNPVIPGFVFTKETVAGSAPIADVTGDPTTDGVYYTALTTTSDLSLKIDADGTNTGTFDLTGISLTRFGVTGTFTFTITGLDASGTAIPGASTTINSAAGGVGVIFDDGTYTNFTGIAGFRIVASEATGTTVHNNITYAGFTIANVAAPVTSDSDGTLTSSATVSEPVALATTATTTGTAVDVFDFTLTDGGGGDGLSMDATQIVLHTSGTGDFSKVVWRLNGLDAANVTGTYNAGANTITFSGLTISVADNTSETYTVNAYYSNNTGLSDGQTYILSVDGDTTDVTLDGAKTQMALTIPVTNGTGSTVNVIASKLVFTTQPAGSVSGIALITKPVVKAVDAVGNVDVDWAANVTVSDASARLSGTTVKIPSSGVATFTDLVYTAVADQENFTIIASSPGLTGAGSNLVTSDVVATKLIYTTQPAPTSVPSGVATAFSTVPVVKAVDANNVTDTGYVTNFVLSEVNGAGSATMTGIGDTDVSPATVTLIPALGAATFTGLSINYTVSGGGNETFNLRASSGVLTGADSAVITGTVDATPPTISAVSIPNAAMKVGDVVTATITVASDTDDYTTGSGGISGTIGGFALGALSKSNNTTYTAQFTVTEGGTDVAAGINVPVSFTMNDSLGNTSLAYTTAISQGADSIDANSPSVSSVSVPANATYVAGQALDFTVTFNENITMVGTASTLGLTIGASGVNATYQAKTATSVTYRYTVQAGDLDTNGIVVGTLTLTGDTIKDSVGNNATLTLNSVGSTAAVLVDAVVPVVSSVSVPANATYITGQTLDFTVTFNENITMVGTASTLGLTIGASGVNAAYQAKTATSVTYRYTVQAGDLDTNGIAVGAISINTDTIKDSAGNNATLTLNSVGATTSVLVDAVAPVVSSVSVPANATYTAGQALDFTVTFNENITMVGTASTLGLTIGASGVNATYQAKTATSVTYRYTVQAGDLDTNGIAVGAITPNGDTIKDSAGNNATLTLNSVGATTSVLVDALAPTAPSVPDMTTATDTGTSNTDNQTGVSTPVFIGTAESGSTVTLSSSVQGVIGSVIASGGNWSITSSTLSLGAHNITATATDVIGNVSAASSPLAVVILSDLDGDGDPDISDPDIDGDGMSNVYEDANGLNKLDANDRDTDLDGDGVSNYDESVAATNANADDYPPIVTPPADVTVDATGLFTAVDVGTGNANDALDGAVTTTSNASTHFAPGLHLVTWSATDAAGNTGTATQSVNVNPIVSLSKNQVTAEGGTVSFSVILNGDFVNAVSVPYTVSGTASTDGSDHDLVDGIATINSGTSTSININIVDDGAGEGTETIVITLGTPINAAIGSASTHTVEIIEGNVAPTVNLSADQGTGNTLTVTQTDGAVSVSSVVTDPNVADSHSYDWTATDNALVDTDGIAATFSFDPLNVTPGFYTLRLSVNDGTASSAAELTLEVLATAPVLTTADSDGDGTDDQTEGYGDSDGDGIADYLDAIVSSNVLQITNAGSNSYLIETEAGLVLKLGSVAFQTGNAQAEIIMSDITNAGGSSDAAGHNYDSGLFDIVIEGGKVITVVIPQRAAIPANAIYRNLTAAGWSAFVEDTENLIYSAAGEAGYCPPPGDAAYQPGLTEGDLCVQLTIVDGGENDADGVVNNRVANLGGVTRDISSNGYDNDSILDKMRDAVGSADPWWLLMIGLLPLRRRGLAANRKMH